MMPICGVPAVSRLLSSLEASGFLETVIVIAQEDKVTVPLLKELLVQDDENDAEAANSKSSNSVGKEDPILGTYQIIQSKPHLVLESNVSMKITVLPLHENCSGSIEALRKVEEAAIVPSTSNMVVLPGDLVVLEISVLRNLCDTHRQGYQGSPSRTNASADTYIPTACSVLLADVGEVDEHGVPLKESAKVWFI
jgi:hypothetical protein